MIPKRIFFFWSNDKMSWLRYMTLYSFRKYHPDWQVDLYVSPKSKSSKPWVDFNVQDFFTYQGADYKDAIKELNINIIPFKLERPGHPEEDWANLPANHESNFCRYLQLSQDGGVHADMDILFLKSLNPLLNELNTAKINAAISHIKHYFSIGFLLSVPNSPFFRDVYLNAFETYQKHLYQGSGILTLHKKWKDWKVLVAAYPDLKFYNIPMNVMYALDSFEVDKIFQQNCCNVVTENTYGIHWYAGHPIAQTFNNNVTEHNYDDYDCTLTHFLKGVLAN